RRHRRPPARHRPVRRRRLRHRRPVHARRHLVVGGRGRLRGRHHRVLEARQHLPPRRRRADGAPGHEADPDLRSDRDRRRRVRGAGRMSTLEIKGLTADVAGKQILNGVDLTVSSGEVHAVMGPNGAGKSTLSGVLAGHPSFTVTGGTATLDGVDLLAMPAWERAKAGLFLAMQYPVEVPGVRLEEMLVESAVAAGRDPEAVRGTIAAEAANIGFEAR